MSTTRIARLAQIVRGQDWWFYKIPPLLAVAYATSILYPSAPRRALTTLVVVLAAICMVASYGYIVNDIFDIDQDRRSGKINRMATVGTGVRLLLCVVLVATGFLLLHAVDASPIASGLLALNFLLPTLYSLPPVRLKERGVLGVLADAGGAHGTPTALIVTALARQATTSGAYSFFLASACGWALFSGLRGIIVHQIADRSTDQLAGSVTFGGRLGAARARRLTFRYLLPCEVASLLLFLGFLLPHAPIVGVLTLVYAVLEVMKIRAGWKLPMFEAPAVSQERYVPLLNNEFYELWLPLGLAVQLAFVSERFLILTVFQAIGFLPNVRKRIGVIRDLFVPARNGDIKTGS